MMLSKACALIVLFVTPSTAIADVGGRVSAVSYRVRILEATSGLTETIDWIGRPAARTIYGQSSECSKECFVPAKAEIPFVRCVPLYRRTAYVVQMRVCWGLHQAQHTTSRRHPQRTRLPLVAKLQTISLQEQSAVATDATSQHR